MGIRQTYNPIKHGSSQSDFSENDNKNAGVPECPARPSLFALIGLVVILYVLVGITLKLIKSRWRYEPGHLRAAHSVAGKTDVACLTEQRGEYEFIFKRNFINL